MPELGTRPLKFGNEGDDVAELQLCLAGFLGGVPDGQFGHGTEGQVKAFQRDWMKREAPDGRADELTFKAIANFAAVHPIDFKALACDCGPWRLRSRIVQRQVFRRQRSNRKELLIRISGRSPDAPMGVSWSDVLLRASWIQGCNHVRVPLFGEQSH